MEINAYQKQTHKQTAKEQMSKIIAKSESSIASEIIIGDGERERELMRRIER